jgi:tRNA (guanine37-N1)-methyltransferase
VRFDVFTLFPEAFAWYLGQVHVRAAVALGHEFVLTDYRDHTPLSHLQVDDAPFGGGAGMVLMAEPIYRAVEAARAERPEARTRVVLLDPAGRPFTQQVARELAGWDRLVLVCGRYEGVDERVRALVDEEISIGDYVVSGGELPAMVVIDAVARLVPGVVGEPESVVRESFEERLLDHPQYTRPAEFRGMKVPEVLLSGHHADIESWRRRMALERTRERRPDLLHETT